MRYPWLLVALLACGGDHRDAASCGSACGSGARAESIAPPDLVAIREAAGQGQLVAVSSDGSQVRVIRPAQTTTRIYPHTHTPIWSADGHYLLSPTDVTFDSSEIIELRSDGSFGPPRSLGDALPGCALPDGRFVVQVGADCVGGGFECTKYYDLSVVDPTTLAKVAIASTRGGGIACSASGKVAFGDGGITVATADGLQTVALASPQTSPLAWMRDERRLVVGMTDLGILDLATGGYRKLMTGDCDFAEAIDDHHVRAVCNQKLVVVDVDAPSADGGAAIDATTARSSPDGSELAYTHGTMSTDAPLVIAPSSGGAALATLPGRWASPAWRPHAALSELIAFKPVPPRPPRAQVAPPTPDPLPPTPPRPMPQLGVVVGDTTRDGKLDPAAQRVVQARTGIFRACYSRVLARDPTLTGGTLTLVLTIDATGAVKPARTGGTIRDLAVTTCVERNASYLKFPADGAGTVSTSITYAVTPAT